MKKPIATAADISRLLDRINTLETVAGELVKSIDRRWDGETEKKRQNCISPRMEEAVQRVRAALLVSE
jgi:hypothetical protein